MAGSSFRRFGRLVKWGLGLCCRLSGECAGKEADRFYLVSTRDWEAILALAGSEAVDGVLAFASDPAKLTAAYVAEECGLPGGPREAAEILGNKEKFRQFLSMYRLPVSGYFCFPDAFSTEAGEKNPGLRYPILIKPVDSSGSKGVTLLRSYDVVSLSAERFICAGQRMQLLRRKWNSAASVRCDRSRLDSLLSGGSCCCNCGGLEQEEKSDGTLLYAIGFTGEYSSHGRIYEACVHRTGTFRH